MKRMIVALVTVALLMMYIVPVYADIPSTMYVVNCNEWVSLRATPHKDAEREAKIPLGAKVTNCHQQGKDWIYCEYGGKCGYVLTKYLSAKAPSKEKGEKIGSMYVVNCDEWVSLRATPSKSANRVAKIPLGAKVNNCIRHDKKWIYCEYDGKCGFVLSEYLTGSISSWAKEQKGKGGSMYVVKCDEYVSLREKPSKSADRLKKVPLGAKVTNCVKFDKTWTFCKYDGKYGFVLTEYLSKSAPADKKKEEKKDKDTGSEKAEIADAYIGTMEVVNCDEWVSLREKPSSSAKRLAKVPLNAVVEDCSWYNTKYIYCCYDGLYGYILASYLQEAVLEDDADEEAPKVVTSDLGGYTLSITRTYPNESENVEVSVSTEDGNLWTRNVNVPYISELDAISVFMGGTEDDPRVMIYAENKLESVSCATGETVWTLDKHLGGSCTKAVTEDGTMYIGGYYGPDPVAIAMDGTVLWSSDANGAYWLYELELADEGLVATYSMSGTGSEKEARICFDYATGAVISSEDIEE